MPEDQDKVIELLSELRTWLRIGFYNEAKSMLADVLDTDKKKLAFQMTDGTTTAGGVRKALAMSPNGLLNLYNRCVEMGLMEITEDKKRRRLFDLKNFGLLPEGGLSGLDGGSEKLSDEAG